MKVLICLIVLSFLQIPNLSAQTENPDRPKNGKWDFQLQEEWTMSEAEGDLFFQITQMKIPYEGPLFLYDYKRAKFFVFDPESGQLLKSFGKQGQGPGEFNMVLDYFVTSDHFIVYDFGKIHFLDLDGEFNYLESKVLDNTTGTPPSLFLDQYRFLSVPRDPAHPEAPKRLDIYNLENDSIKTIAGIPPSELKLKSSKTKQAVTNLGGGGAGAFRSTETYIMTLKDDLLYFGLNDQYIIKSVDLEGELKMSFSLNSRKRTKTSKEYQKSREDNLRRGSHNFPPSFLQQMIDNIPQEATFFYKLHVDEKGMIYVFVSDIENTDIEYIDIFSPKGEYVYQSEIKSPEGFSFHSGGIHFFKNNMFCVVENDDGEIHLIKYKITPPPSK